MDYSIRELSEVAGVSARTLRYYDEIGLLHPKYVSEAGYRFYGEEEVVLLQQILFYRERGFDLKSIQKIIYQKDFDVLSALQEHLLELEEQSRRTEALIRSVKKTIKAMKGECSMSNAEKFEAFKKQTVEENENTYGKEMRAAYGDEVIDAANARLLNMSSEEWNHYDDLEKRILEEVESCVREQAEPQSERAKQLVCWHKEWIQKRWQQYTAKGHIGIANMYVSDERFTKYYDRNVTGCAAFLRDAVAHWAMEIA